VNSLPKTVTRQRPNCDLNPGPSASESSTLTTRLQCHPHGKQEILIDCCTAGAAAARSAAGNVGSATLSAYVGS